MANASTAIRVFKYRLYPNAKQETNLLRVFDCARNLYNMALAERKYAYQLEGHSVTLADTEELAKHYRATFPYADQLFSQTAQSVVKQVDGAFQRFFRRVKAGKKAGYPRFKGVHHFHSIEFKQYGNWRENRWTPPQAVWHRAGAGALASGTGRHNQDRAHPA